MTAGIFGFSSDISPEALAEPIANRFGYATPVTENGLIHIRRLGDALLAQTKFAVASGLVDTFANRPNRSDSFIEFADNFLRASLGRLTNPLSRSTSIISNINEDLEHAVIIDTLLQIADERRFAPKRARG